MTAIGLALPGQESFGYTARVGPSLLQIRSLSLAALLFLLGGAACGERVPAQEADGVPRELLAIETVAGARHEFRVEIADTIEERSQGLMFRSEMAADAGMLFEYAERQYITMWMANTVLPLDMVFIAASGRILNIAERTVPQSRAPIPSAGLAVAVLELNAGTASRLGLAPGDLVLHGFFGTVE